MKSDNVEVQSHPVDGSEWLYTFYTGFFVSFFFSNGFVYDKMSCGRAHIRVISGKA